LCCPTIRPNPTAARGAARLSGSMLEVGTASRLGGVRACSILARGLSGSGYRRGARVGVTTSADSEPARPTGWPRMWCYSERAASARIRGRSGAEITLAAWSPSGRRGWLKLTAVYAHSRWSPTVAGGGGPNATAASRPCSTSNGRQRSSREVRRPTWWPRLACSCRVPPASWRRSFTTAPQASLPSEFDGDVPHGPSIGTC
jgi:hypothetical protein